MWKRWPVIAAVVGLVLAISLALVVAFIAGALVGERDTYQSRYLEERGYVEPQLKGQPAFAKVDIRERSNGGIWLSGRVSTASDLETLRSVLRRAIGERRAEEAIRTVEIRED
jgi:hypothetical protein